jgi:hypothetical protein
MKHLKVLAFLVLSSVLVACSGIEVEVGDPTKFAAGNFKTYSWRSEPFTNAFYSRDSIYQIDPILREIVDRELQRLGFRKVPRNGDFTIDYVYAPGTVLGAPSDDVSNVSPRAGVRPNTRISGAERDNAIALSGVKETRNIILQINDGRTQLGIWQATITKIIANVNEVSIDRARSSMDKGIRQAFRELPGPGQS